MNHFILQTLRKFDKVTREQAHDVFAYAVDEIDRLETVLDSINLGILVCDDTHKLLLTNKYAERLLYIRDYEHGADPLWLLLHEDVISDFLRTTLYAGDRVEGHEFEVDAQGGIPRLLSISVLPLVKLYRVTGSLILVEDVTEKRVRELKLRRIESLASLTTLAAGVAHEIKNPLAAISIHIQLIKKMFTALQENNSGGNQEEIIPYQKFLKHLDVVNEEIERLNHIVVDFLFAVRPINLTLIKADINALLEDIISFVSCELEERHINCKMELAEKLPLVIFDKRFMKEAFLNLIKNAVESMHKNGGTLTIRTEYNDADIIISIIDTGEGMNEEQKAKIFEPYFTTKAFGTGLGLTLVFKTIREHRGEITVHSKEGKGSCFVITLPIPQTEQKLLDYHQGGNYEI